MPEQWNVCPCLVRTEWIQRTILLLLSEKDQGTGYQRPPGSNKKRKTGSISKAGGTDSAPEHKSSGHHPSAQCSSGNKRRCQPADCTGSAPCTAEHLLGDISVVENIYIACGYTDMRKSIDGLAVIVQEQFHLDPFSKSLFLFCGKRRDRIKCLLWEGDGFLLLYKRLENGSFKWPRKESEVRPISWQQFRWLMEGLEIEQKSIILPAEKAALC